MVEAATLRIRAYNALRLRLLRGDFAVHHRLIAEDLAEIIGISRTPVREALMQLASEGLVNLIPRAGWFVSLPDAAQQYDLFETRILVEGYSAAGAAQLANPVERAQLRELLMQQRHEARRLYENESLILDPACHYAWNELDIAFHRQILRCCGNGMLLPIADGTGLLTRVAIVSQTLARKRIDLAVGGTASERAAMVDHLRRVVLARLKSHYRIARAILRRDAASARAAMIDHIQYARSNASQVAISQEEALAVASE